MRPHRNAPPLPLLDDLGVGLLDERTDTGERPPPPVVQFPDPRVDQPGRGCALGRGALLHGVRTSRVKSRLASAAATASSGDAARTASAPRRRRARPSDRNGPASPHVPIAQSATLMSAGGLAASG